MGKGTLTVMDGGKGRKKPEGWMSQLTRTDKGAIQVTLHNLMLILEHDEALDGLLGLDEFANRVQFTRAPPWPGFNIEEFTECDGTELAGWLGRPDTYSLSAKSALALEAAEAVARRHKFHPVRQYLDGLEWDGEERIPGMFPRWFGSESGAYYERVAEIFMISAVARIYRPGCKVDTMLVLEGAQGIGKTKFTNQLFGDKWYGEAQESPATKDFYQNLAGKWCMEIGEMDAFSKADVTKVKQAVSAKYDTYRPSYGRYSRSFPRQCVFVGTTNEDHYLRDPTGARRFLPIRASGVQQAQIDDVRDQLWAEAKARFERGEDWWTLPPEAIEQQENRYMADSWEEVLQGWLRGEGGDKSYPPRLGLVERDSIAWVTTSELLYWPLAIDVGKQTKQDQMRLSQCMKRLGWESVRGIFNGERMRRWVRVDGSAERKQEGGGDAPF